MKVLWLMPSALARRVIIWLKRSSLPPSNSLSADAASLADFVTSPRIASSTVSRELGSRPSFRRFHRRGMRRDRNGLIEGNPTIAQTLERQIECHHLGENGGVARLIGIHLLQHVSARGIDNNGTVPG